LRPCNSQRSNLTLAQKIQTIILVSVCIRCCIATWTIQAIQLRKIDLRENKQKRQYQSVFNSIQHALELELKIEKTGAELNSE